MIISKSISDLSNSFEKIGNREISNDEFKKVLNDEIKSLSKLPEASKIAKTLQDATNYSFTKEDKLIESLIDNSNKKFDELKSIINEEKTKTQKIYRDYEEKLNTPISKNILSNIEL